MKIQSSLIAGLAAVSLLSGCVTSGPRNKMDLLDATRRAIDRNTTATLAVGTGTVTNSVAPIEAASVKLGEAAAGADAQYEQLRKEMERQQLEFRTFVTGALAVAGEVATEVVPGGGAAVRALGLISNRVKTAQTDAVAAQQASEAAKKEAAAAAADAQKQIANLKTELAAKEDLLKQQAMAREALQKKEMELALKEVASLSTQQQAELRQELITVAKEHGIEGAENMSTQELLSVLGAAGLGLAGLMRTFGKGRDHADVERLKEKVETIDKTKQPKPGV